MNADEQFQFLRAEFAELRRLLNEAPPRPDDLVDANYIAARTGLSLRTVQEGKAGTSEIPRVLLQAGEGKRSLIRYQRAAVDKWIRDLGHTAASKTPKVRALKLLDPKQKRRATG